MSSSRAGCWLLCNSAAWSFQGGRASAEVRGSRRGGRRTAAPLRGKTRCSGFRGGPGPPLPGRSHLQPRTQVLLCPAHSARERRDRCRRWQRQVAAPSPPGPGVGAGAQDRGPGDSRRLRRWEARSPTPQPLLLWDRCVGAPGSGFPGSREPPWGCPGGPMWYRRPSPWPSRHPHPPPPPRPSSRPGLTREGRGLLVSLVSWPCHSAVHLVSPGGPFGWLGVAP